MAARAIVAERKSIAIDRIRKDAAALSEALGVDASALTEDVKGDAAFQEMTRTEQLADLLAAVREKVATPKQRSADATPVADPDTDAGQPEPAPVSRSVDVAPAAAAHGTGRGANPRGQRRGEHR